jgi:hypothetical protein
LSFFSVGRTSATRCSTDTSFKVLATPIHMDSPSTAVGLTIWNGWG